jgi:hypothetical protein
MWLWGVVQFVLWVFYNEKSIWQHFILTCDHFRDMTQWVEPASDVGHLHNIKRQRSSPLWHQIGEHRNLWFWSPNQHLPQLQFQHFQILWFWFIIVNMLKLPMLDSIGLMIPHGWRCPHEPHLPYLCKLRSQESTNYLTRPLKNQEGLMCNHIYNFYEPHQQNIIQIHNNALRPIEQCYVFE